MSSHKKGAKKSLVINLDPFTRPQKTRQHSTASTSNSEPVVDGITTTSGMELPFSLDDPSHDPIFQTSPSKYAADSASSAAEKAPAESSSDMETDTDDSDDSSIDVPRDRQRPPVARKKTNEQKKSTTTAANDETTTAVAAEQNKSAQAQPKRKASTSSTSAPLQPNNNSPPEKEGSGERPLGAPPAEGPSRKRARTQAGDSMESNNENDPPSNQLSTPPLGEQPRPRLNEEEQRLFDKIDRMILDDEWEQLKEKIDGQILAAEEEDLLSRIDQSIRAAEAAAKPGGKVLYQAQVLEDGSLEEEYLPVTEDPLLVDEDYPKKSPANKTEGQRERVFDVEDFSVEVSRKARLPKYSKNAQERLLTRQVLAEQVVGPIMAEERTFALPGKLAVRLDDSPDDPHSVLLHCQGHPHLVERVETQVSELIQAEQRRLKEQEAREKSEASSRELSGKPSPQEVQRRKALAAESTKKYQEFAETYKDVIDIIKGEVSGLNRHKVKSCMWDCHKQKYGTECGDDCECASDLPYLASTVISSYIASEIKKDPNWNDRVTKTIGFVDCFAEKFYPLLEKEYPDESPKQLLARLVLMWWRHKKERRFATSCSKNCPCLEGWELVFKKGRLYPNEIAEDKERTKKTASNQSARIPRRRPSNETSNTGLLAMASGSTTERAKEASHAAVPRRIPRRQSSARDVTDAAPGQLISNLPPQSLTTKPASIPRRQPAATSGAASVPKKSGAIARKASSASQSQASQNRNRSYEILYQPGEAMGFFCVNESENGSPVCKIVSLDDSTARKHPQLQVGAIANDVTHEGGHVQPIRTYSDLNQHYKKAKKNGTSITVRFMNPNNSSSLIGNLPGPDSRAVYGEWTPSGEWKGTSQGWPGGARCITDKDSRSQQAAAQKPQGGSQPEVGRQPSLQGQAGGMAQTQPPVNRAASPPQSPKAPALQYSTTMAPANHRESLPSKSILRKPTDWSKKKEPSVSDAEPGEGDSIFKKMAGAGPKQNIRFSDKCEKRFYEKKSKSFCMAPEISSSSSSVDGAAASTDSALAVAAPPKAPGTKELIDAIEKKDFREVIAVLQAGASPSEKYVGKTPKEHVKKRLKELDFELAHDPGNPTLVAQRRDFDLKSKVLSTYIEAMYTIDKARYNREWKRFKVKVDRIKNVCLSVRGADHEGSQVLQCRSRLKGEQMPPSPFIPIDGTIMADWRSDPTASGYAFNYNHGLADPKRRHFVLSLYKGSKEDAAAPLLLSEADIELSRISTAADEKERIVERLDPTEFIANCSIELTASKPDGDEDTRLRKEKTAEAVSALKAVVEWITRFNEEKGVDVGTLSGHITEPESGISLLHAAIYLEEADLISQLIRLGADPEAPSHAGSARLLASNQFGDRAESDPKARKLLSLLRGNGDREQCGSVNTDIAAPPEEASMPTASLTGLTVDTHTAAPPQEASITASTSEDNPKPPAARPEQQPQVTLPQSLALSASSSPGSEGNVARLPSYSALAGSSGSDSRDLVKNTATASPQNATHMTPYSTLADEASSNRAPPVVNNRSSPPKAAAGYTLPLSSPNDNPRVPVPVFDFWRFHNEERCRFFGKEGAKGCHRGPQCRYMHVSRPVGHALEREQLQVDNVSLNSERVVKKAMRNGEGRVFHTAAYRDPRDNVWYVAEGGPVIGKSKGVSWYNTEEEAMHALKRVVAFHRPSQISMYGHQPQRPHDNHGEHGIYGPSQPSRPKRPHEEPMDSRRDSGEGKRARRGSTDASPRSNSSNSLFNKMMRQPNISLVHGQIFFGKALRRDDWTINRDNQGRFTASFASPLDHSKRYYSTEQGGGVMGNDGSYWFKDEKTAKASAFHSLLESCIRWGTVNADCTMSKEGSRLSL